MKITVVWRVWHTAVLLHVKERKRWSSVVPLLSSEWAHARPHRPPPATLFHTFRTHCQGWGHQAFHLKFLYIVILVVVFVGLCVGVWFYGTVWLIRFHRSFYLPHSSALPSKHTIIKFSRLSASDNAQKHRQRQRTTTKTNGTRLWVLSLMNSSLNLC